MVSEHEKLEQLEPTGRARLIVADDHPSLLDDITRLLATRFAVVGRARTGRELIRMARNLLPVAVVVDMDLPDLNGLAVTTLMKQEFAHIHVVVISLDSHPMIVEALFRAGASGFVAKAAADVELIPVIRDLLGDGSRRP